MTDKEFLEHIKANEELQQRGYTKEPCSSCKGKGIIFWGTQEICGDKCALCDGRGYHWKGPLTK